jgi:hypothetical protein
MEEIHPGSACFCTNFYANSLATGVRDMLHTADRAPACLWFVVVSLVAASVFSGCTGGSHGTREDEQQQAAKGFKQAPVAKMAGHVSIDGQPPEKETTLFVILNDPQHLTLPKTGPAHFAECDAEGNFAFTSYLKGDGVPLGKYVVTFAQLRLPSAAGRHPMGRGNFKREYIGPDGMKNLYNDPEKNKNEKDFNIEVVEPGKTDYEFNLSVAGKNGLSPAQYAVTRIGG